MEENKVQRQAMVKEHFLLEDITRYKLEEVRKP